MYRDILDGLKVVVIAFPLGCVSLILLSLGISGTMPHFPAFSAPPDLRECAAYQPTFAAAFVPAMAERPAEQLGTALEAVHKIFLDTLYTVAVEHNPDLTCAVAFLRQKDLTVAPGFVLTHVLPRLFLAQRQMISRGERI